MLNPYYLYFFCNEFVKFASDVAKLVIFLQSEKGEISK